MAIELIKTLELCYPLIQCLNNKAIYYIDTSVLLENTLLVKFIQNYIRDPSGVFSPH